MKNLLKSLFAISLTLVIFTCKKNKVGEKNDSPQKISSIVLAARLSTLSIGDTVTVKVIAKDANGVVVNNVVYSWSSSDSKVAEIKEGLIKALSPGTTIVSASVNGISNQLTVTVTWDYSLNLKIGSNVPEVIRKSIVYYSGISDTINVTSKKHFKLTGGEELMLAMNQNDEVVLMSIVSPKNLEFNAQSTAMALVKIGMDLAESSQISSEDLDNKIINLAEFVDLRNTLQTNLVTSNFQLTDTEVLRKTAIAIAALTNMILPVPKKSTLGNQDRLMSIRGARLAGITQKDLPYYFIESVFRGENLFLTDFTGSGVIMHNDTRINWMATSYDDKGFQIDTKELEWTPSSLLDIIPYGNPESQTALSVKNGAFSIRVTQSDKTRAKHLLFNIQKFILWTFKWAKANDQDKSTQIACSAKIAELILNKDLPNLLTTADGKALQQYLNSIKTSFDWKTIVACNPKFPNPQKVFVERFLKSLSLFYTRIDDAITLATLLNFNSQLYRYWKTSLSVNLCKNNGVIGECAISQASKIVKVSGDLQTQIMYKKLNPFVIQVLDNNNNPVPNVKVNWSAGAAIDLPIKVTDANGKSECNYILNYNQGLSDPDLKATAVSENGAVISSVRFNFVKTTAPKPAIAGVYDMVSLREIPVGGTVGLAQGFGGDARIDPGNATLGESSWQINLYTSAFSQPINTTQPWFFSGASFFYAGVTDIVENPLGVNAKCPGLYNGGYCSLLPYGHLWVTVYSNGGTSFFVFKPDGTMITNVGGQTVWRKR